MRVQFCNITLFLFRLVVELPIMKMEVMYCFIFVSSKFDPNAEAFSLDNCYILGFYGHGYLNLLWNYRSGSNILSFW